MCVVCYRESSSVFFQNRSEWLCLPQKKIPFSFLVWTFPQSYFILCGETHRKQKRNSYLLSSLLLHLSFPANRSLGVFSISVRERECWHRWAREIFRKMFTELERLLKNQTNHKNEKLLYLIFYSHLSVVM